MPALVRIESLGPSFNTLAADDKYSHRNMQKFQQQLQTALSQKQKIFSASKAFCSIANMGSNLDIGKFSLPFRSKNVGNL